MSVWPVSLPLPLSNTLQETPPQSLIRTQMDAGVPKVRRRSTATVRQLSFQVMLSASQVSTLDTFFLTTTLGGSEEFDYTHPRTGAAVTARFTAPPTYADANTGDHFLTTIELEILP